MSGTRGAANSTSTAPAFGDFRCLNARNCWRSFRRITPRSTSLTSRRFRPISALLLEPTYRWNVSEKLKSGGYSVFALRTSAADVVVTYVDGEGKSGHYYASKYAEENQRAKALCRDPQG